MMRATTLACLAPTALFLWGCDKASAPAPSSGNEAAAAPATSSDPVQSALSAAPAGVAKGAAVVTLDPDGSMKMVKEGSNGFTCMPDNPKTPGPDPMCMDGNAMKWVEAWVGKKTPPANNVGLMYMLAGGTDASNVDPHATDPAKGKWVETGPHLMVVGAPTLVAQYKGQGETPDTSVPYTMWEGTPYAHLMIPVK